MANEFVTRPAAEGFIRKLVKSAGWPVTPDVADLITDRVMVQLGEQGIKLQGPRLSKLVLTFDLEAPMPDPGDGLVIDAVIIEDPTYSDPNRSHTLTDVEADQLADMTDVDPLPGESDAAGESDATGDEPSGWMARGDAARAARAQENLDKGEG